MRKKYSPSLSTSSRVSQGPAALVNSRLTSQVAVCIWRFSSHFLNSHSNGERSHHKELGANFAFFGRYMKYPHSQESNLSLLWDSFVTAICLWILSGARRSSASSHWIYSPWQTWSALFRAADAP